MNQFKTKWSKFLNIPDFGVKSFQHVLEEKGRVEWGIIFSTESCIVCHCSVFWPLEKNCSDILKKNGWQQRWSPGGWADQPSRGPAALIQPAQLPSTGREEAGHCVHAGGGLPGGNAERYSEYLQC